MPHIRPAFFASYRLIHLSRLLRGLPTTVACVALAVAVSACNPFDPNSAGAASQNVSTENLLASGDPNLVLLLIPDGESPNQAPITAWLDAASELGIRVVPVTDKQFMAMGADALKFAGMILPDQIHTLASDALVGAVREFTQTGGLVMLVYDFGIFRLDGNQKPTYPIPSARLSDLAGVQYALYDKLREKTAVAGPVIAMRSTLRRLQVPPGKSVDYQVQASNGVSASPYIPVSSAAAAPSATQPGAAPDADVLQAYSGYLLGPLNYASFVTEGAYDGRVLAASPTAGLVTGLRSMGKGKVLFVNLPLTALKVARTDGLPLHGSLQFFAQEVLQLAKLSPVPNGVAGLTLNWHLDSFTAQQPTLTLEKLGVFREGPFSIDMTTGPDAVTPGDGRGWNLDNNPIAQNILKRFVAGGHAVGSHGGWNHDYYGLNANETNRETFLPYLVSNLQSVQRTVSSRIRPWLGPDTANPPNVPAFLLPLVGSLHSTVNRVLGPPVREYSPPVGNNPTWAMDWLEEQGIVGVYFAGHTGLGPTRQYREGRLRNPSLWVFPVTPAGRYATFEEFQVNGVPKQEVVAWYHDSVDFARSQNTTRMIYMHPNGANVWPDVLQDLLAYAKSQGSDKFQWYTMPRLADFMTTRQFVSWREQRSASGLSQFEASHPSTLREMVWMLPKTRYPEPPVSPDGSAVVTDRGTQWAVSAGNVREVRFSARTR